MRTAQSGETRDKLTNELRAVIRDAEDLLKNTGEQVGDQYQSARTRFASTLQSAKSTLGASQESIAKRTKEAAQTTDQYVHDNPWRSVGIVAAASIVIGLLIGRK
jgi:ElaB/YqjD/DUF883 family membrane-anchored ribosome-binding protein